MTTESPRISVTVYINDQLVHLTFGPASRRRRRLLAEAQTRHNREIVAAREAAQPALDWSNADKDTRGPYTEELQLMTGVFAATVEQIKTDYHLKVFQALIDRSQLPPDLIRVIDEPIEDSPWWDSFPIEPIEVAVAQFLEVGRVPGHADRVDAPGVDGELPGDLAATGATPGGATGADSVPADS